MTAEETNKQKQLFASEKKPSMKRRKDGHDYRGERFYMITLAVEGRYPILGHVEGRGESDDAKMVLSPLGERVQQEWMHISSIYRQVAVVALQVMPDHLHGILYVREHTDFHLGQVIKGFKLGCNRVLREMLVAMESQPTREGAQPTREGVLITAEGASVREGENKTRNRACPLPLYATISSQPPAKASLWEPGYNDRILHNYSTLEKWKTYLRENPRRLAIRRAHPEYFRVCFNQRVGQHSFSTIGNRFLLDCPEKVQVQLSRSLTTEQVAIQTDKFLTMAHNGAVLVSPAISKGEQAVMRAALDAAYPLIFLTPWGFNTFSKPGHEYYEACSSGHFLILAPWPHHNERIPLTRQMCLELNQMAKDICEGHHITDN